MKVFIFLIWMAPVFANGQSSTPNNIMRGGNVHDSLRVRNFNNDAVWTFTHRSNQVTSDSTYDISSLEFNYIDGVDVTVSRDEDNLDLIPIAHVKVVTLDSIVVVLREWHVEEETVLGIPVCGSSSGFTGSTSVDNWITITIRGRK